MEYIVFNAAVDNLFEYFMRSAPTERQKKSWFEVCKNIPGEAVGSILLRLKKNEDRLPTNIPKTLWREFFSWRRENPERMLVINEKCGSCFGRGYYILFGIVQTLKTDDGETQHVKGTCVCACGDCRNFMHRFGSAFPRLSKSEIEARGYSILYPKKESGEKKWVSNDEIQALKKNTVHDVPF